MQIFKIVDCEITIDNKQILKPISFEVNENDFLTIIGKSGCGKSTLLQILLGFMKPTSGKLFYNGIEITDKNFRILRDNVAVVFQEPKLNGDSIEEAILEPFTFKVNKEKKPTIKEIEVTLKDVGLTNIDLSKEIDTLSGGEKQRIALVKALLLKPTILILDEVTSALDPESKVLIQKLLIAKKITVINVSHDSNWIKNSDRVMEIKD